MDIKKIKELALANGFKLKEQASGNMDLNAYVYDFANAIEQAAKAQAVPEGFVLVERDLIQSIHQSCNNALDINDRDIYKGLCMAIIDDAEAMIEAQEPTND